MSLLEVQQLRKDYGEASRAKEAIAELTFSVDAGEFVCVIGPSGCGKTTLLRCISGLVAPTSGSVILGGQRVIRPPETMALVFQDYSRSLFPWLTVRQNIALPLRRLQLDSKARRRRVEEAAGSVDLMGCIDQYPRQLSGGMQQRVAIARALAYQPRVLLMDEPFASVDAQSREDLEDLTLLLAKRSEMTVLFVTHDIDESVYLGDRVIVLTPGPARIRETVTIELPRPRDQIETKGLAQYGRLRAQVTRLVKRKP